MKVFLLKSVPRVGMEGEIVVVNEGYGRNFLIPRKIAIEVTPKNQSTLIKKIKVLENRKTVIESEISLLAEKIKTLQLTLSKKMHEGEKLYGAVTAHDIVELLKQEGINISKNQVLFRDAIKSKGIYNIAIKLSPQLKPALTLNIVPE